MKRTLLSAIAATGALSAAPGTTPAYVGRWSEEPYTCRKDGTISITAREMHLLELGLCRFNRVDKGPDHWHVAMTCQGEGSTENVTADLVVEGDFLRVVYGNPYKTTAKFKRCGSSGTATAEPGQPAVTSLAQPLSETPRHPVDRAAYRAKAMAFLTLGDGRGGGSSPKVFFGSGRSE
ncbi:hypothetical protein [Methylobacterium sp. NEAU K]|uniref:hypothetical protein n=1 Tax=Methylobacterium sp. NEAU K TaxID=3064946 RepID=UPI00273474FE|nr:hypothetical protein [Methylobacterium sp. NEAU K]MDP4006488.1 hypothetical protein [Methylobacterium sp. NEAU K]